MIRSVAHEIAELARRTHRRMKHAVERLAQIRGDAIGQARNDRARREDFRIGREHHRRHAATGGQAGDEDASGIYAMCPDHVRDHLADRLRLAAAARRVFRAEPVEAGVAVVDALLLGHQQREAIMLGQRRPTRAEIVSRRRLAAAMQHDDERTRLLQLLRHEREHAQGTGVAAEAGDLLQRTGHIRAAAELGKAQTVQPWQASQQIDIFG